MKKGRCFAFLLIAVLFCECAHKTMEVEKEAINTLGDELFSKFKFNLSRDIYLQQIVVVGEHLFQTAPGTVTVFDVELHFSRSIIGRFQKETDSDIMEISFEELDDGTRPTLAFKHDPSDKKYYLKTEKPGKNDYIPDPTARYGYSKVLNTVNNEIVIYNGLRYLLKDSSNKPYLIQELDVQVVPNRREVKGIKKID